MKDGLDEVVEMFRESPWLAIIAIILLILVVGAFDDPLLYDFRNIR